MNIGITVKILLVIVVTIAAIYDMRTMTVPMWTVYLLTVLSVCMIILRLTERKYAGQMRLILLSCIPWILICICNRCNIDLIGTGDGVMIANIGIIMTLSGLFFVLAMALTLASVSSAILLVFKKVKKHDRIPFVPFLAVGTAASVFFFR